MTACARFDLFSQSQLPRHQHTSTQRKVNMLRSNTSGVRQRLASSIKCSAAARPLRSSKRTYATLTELSKPGDQLHGFTLKRAQHVPELQLTALQLQHDKTGAEYLHVARDDKNNVFSISFKTNPPNDTGVPHILEHTTLCGSEK